jgi:hypothetical protein
VEWMPQCGSAGLLGLVFPGLGVEERFQKASRRPNQSPHCPTRQAACDHGGAGLEAVGPWATRSALHTSSPHTALWLREETPTEGRSLPGRCPLARETIHRRRGAATASSYKPRGRLQETSADPMPAPGGGCLPQTHSLVPTRPAEPRVRASDMRTLCCSTTRPWGVGDETADD